MQHAPNNHYSCQCKNKSTTDFLFRECWRGILSSLLLSSNTKLILKKKIQDFKYKLKKTSSYLKKKKPSTQLFITVTITRVKSKNFSSIWRLLIKPVGRFNFICICYFKTKLATHSYQSSSQNTFCTHSSSLTSMPRRHSRVPQDT